MRLNAFVQTACAFFKNNTLGFYYSREIYIFGYLFELFSVNAYAVIDRFTIDMYRIKTDISNCSLYTVMLVFCIHILHIIGC